MFVLLGSIVMFTLVTDDEPEIGNQKFVSARLTELLCSVQPRWSPGHVSCIVLPTTEAVIFVGVVLTEATTPKTPVAGLKVHSNPLPGEPRIFVKTPDFVPLTLNIWNVSLVVIVPERLVANNVPP